MIKYQSSKSSVSKKERKLPSSSKFQITYEKKVVKPIGAGLTQPANFRLINSEVKKLRNRKGSNKRFRPSQPERHALPIEAKNPTTNHLSISLQTCKDVLVYLDVIKKSLVEPLGKDSGEYLVMEKGSYKDLDIVTSRNFELLIPFKPKIFKGKLLGNRVKKEYDTFVSLNGKTVLFYLLSLAEMLADQLGDVFLTLDGRTILNAFYEYSSSKENIVKIIKYQTCYPMAKYLKNDLPMEPYSGCPAFPFRGLLKEVIRRRLKTKSKRNLSLFQSFLQGVKRATSLVPKSFIVSSLLDHAHKLSKPVNAIDDEIFDNFSVKLSKLFKRILFPQKLLHSHWEPSNRASFELGAVGGGQHEVIDSQLIEDQLISLSQSNLHSMNQHIHGDYKAIVSRVIEENYFLELVKMCSSYSLNMNRLSRRPFIENTFCSSSDLHKEFPLCARVVPVIEPLKVRIITAGESIPYYVSKPLQKQMHTYLKKLPAFRLIGEELSEHHLQEMMHQHDYLNSKFWNNNQNCIMPDEFFVSGDFSAATDGLKIDYTLLTFDSVIQSLLPKATDRVLQYLFAMRSVLEPHDLYYNYNFFNNSTLSQQQMKELSYKIVSLDAKKSYYVVRQNTGQLMGSPLSFPLLCAINFICYWLSIEEYTGAIVKLEECPVRVNGDDIIFRSNTEHYAIWKRYISEVGFTLSLGKNYIHSTILTINSQCYLYHRTSRDMDHTFELIDYFNPGLLIAQSKGRVANKYKKLTLREIYYKVLCGSRNKLRSHLRFIHHNRHQIELMTNMGKYNLFIPVQYGGLGFPVFPEILSLIKITSFQRRFATFLNFKVQEKLAEGTYPKKYFFALLSPAEPKARFLIYHGKYDFKLVPKTSPLEKNWEYFTEDPSFRLDPFYEKLWPTYEDEYSEPDYRLPSKTILRQFNRCYHSECFSNMNRMSDYDLFNPINTVLVYKRSAFLE